MNGVWLACSDLGGYDERIYAIYREDEKELAEAFVKRNGYGGVEYVEFGDEL